MGRSLSTLVLIVLAFAAYNPQPAIGADPVPYTSSLPFGPIFDAFGIGPGAQAGRAFQEMDRREKAQLQAEATIQARIAQMKATNPELDQSGLAIQAFQDEEIQNLYVDLDPKTASKFILGAIGAIAPEGKITNTPTNTIEFQPQGTVGFRQSPEGSPNSAAASANRPVTQAVGTDRKVYDASECIGPVIMGECKGSILPNRAHHPTCHGQMLNGQCTGPMF